MGKIARWQEKTRSLHLEFCFAQADRTYLEVVVQLS